MGNICIIGPRMSGKTTYLAALSYLPELEIRTRRRSIFKIMPLGEDGKKLAENAEDILTAGLMFRPTAEGIYESSTVDDLPFYSFKIEAKHHRFQKAKEIYLNVKDYPGEVFEHIINPNMENTIFKEFIEECLAKDIVGCLILCTGLEKGADKFYRSVMTRFLELMDVHERTNNLRLAVTISKCERGEIWPGRIDPETDFFKVYLPRTHNLLRERLNSKNLRFYATSAFGVLKHNDPRPNRQMVSENREGSILRQAETWRPYNLIEPLYWLSQG
ncbi:hypothetical protein IQE94_13185 [Synechocystis sp. PCC 7339]|uniref:hypothetical protein n=1 Tax=Synechocystis sp. PCC 7339 TaxID=2782213 RepID=UPI001CBB0F00|nr:hypothetical protein [Synechocystis sp. PCC 7339]UAJ72050.1 hypothetical protein IQE94_13185 [Synechocystis sp. PCC 7339]